MTGVIASFVVPAVWPALPMAHHAFGAARLFFLIVLVAIAILACLIVPLEVRLARERRARAAEPAEERDPDADR
jgi:hypothetical protein